jgi:hypothetical protein
MFYNLTNRKETTSFKAFSIIVLLFSFTFVLFINSCQTRADNPTNSQTAINAVSKNIKTVDGTFGPTDKPYDESYDNWAAKWWQWILTCPVQEGPNIVHPLLAADVDAQSAFLDGWDDPNVIMLVGSFDGTVAHERNITYSGSKALFFPFWNAENDIVTSPGDSRYGQLKKFINTDVNQIKSVSELKLEIDGNEINSDYLWQFKFISPPFDYIINNNSLLAYWGVPYNNAHVRKASCNGYWMMLKPLTAGYHTLHFYASSGTGVQDITYHITVN